MAAEVVSRKSPFIEALYNKGDDCQQIVIEGGKISLVSEIYLPNCKDTSSFRRTDWKEALAKKGYDLSEGRMRYHLRMQGRGLERVVEYRAFLTAWKNVEKKLSAKYGLTTRLDITIDTFLERVEKQAEKILNEELGKLRKITINTKILTTKERHEEDFLKLNTYLAGSGYTLAKLDVDGKQIYPPESEGYIPD